MGIDHGLGGRNNEKSKLKRAKKAKHVKSFAKSVVSKKGEVIFDESARAEFLTGFRKRKQEKRKYGLAMGLLKKQRNIREARKFHRKGVIGTGEASEEQEEEEKNDEVSKGKEEELTFDDDYTQNMFNGEVSVVVSTELADKLEESSRFGEIKANSTKVKNEPTRLEKALIVAKGQLGKKKGGGSKRYKKEKGTKLLHKAIGSGAMGQNFSYKGGRGKNKKK
jgi:ribosomal RNA-processing protein 17